MNVAAGNTLLELMIAKASSTISGYSSGLYGATFAGISSLKSRADPVSNPTSTPRNLRTSPSSIKSTIRETILPCSSAYFTEARLAWLQENPASYLNRYLDTMECSLMRGSLWGLTPCAPYNNTSSLCSTIFPTPLSRFNSISLII